MKIGWIAFGIALVALVLGLGCQAKDYKEKIGPYEVNFTLPDDTASNIKLKKTITSGEYLDGTTYNTYSIGLQVPETTNQFRGYLWITHFNRAYEVDLAKAAENVEAVCKGDGYNAANSAARIIDGHDGYIVECFGSELRNNHYLFGYQLDNQTSVQGGLLMDWDTDVLPLLKSLHVKEVP